MRLRVLILDDDSGIRQCLSFACVRRGYEVFTFPHPGVCPLHVMDRCPCAPGITCADVILSDLKMPQVQGLDFVEALVAKGCVVRHIALMSGEWSDADETRAARLGCQLFCKPVTMAEIDAWLAKVETLVPRDRGLLQWESCGWGQQTQPPPARS